MKVDTELRWLLCKTNDSFFLVSLVELAQCISYYPTFKKEEWIPLYVYSFLCMFTYVLYICEIDRFNIFFDK